MNPQSGAGWSKALGPVIPNFWELAIYAIGAVVLIWLTFRIKAGFRDDDAGTGHNNDLLTDLRELHRQGGLSDEEFRLIKTQLVGTRTGVSAPRPTSANVADSLQKTPLSAPAEKSAATPASDEMEEQR